MLSVLKTLLIIVGIYGFCMREVSSSSALPLSSTSVQSGDDADIDLDVAVTDNDDVLSDGDPDILWLLLAVSVKNAEVTGTTFCGAKSLLQLA